MGLLVFLIFGLLVGLLARALVPGRQSMGIIATTLLGVAGSLLGGLLGSLIGDAEPTRLQAAGLIGSIIGAMIVLALATWATRRRALT